MNGAASSAAGFIIPRNVDMPLSSLLCEFTKFIPIMNMALVSISVFPNIVLLIPNLAGCKP